jgi:hypothetical protein
MIHEPNGNADEDLLYNDNNGNADTIHDTYTGNGQLYNIFYVRSMNAGEPTEQYGQLSSTRADDGITTQTLFEDNTLYTYSVTNGLEQMYKSFAAGPAVTNCKREIIYIRPNRIIVYDTTTISNSTYDQYISWHFSANPVVTGDQLAVTYNGSYLGNMTSVLPANPVINTLALYPTSATPKVWEAQIRPSNTNVNQKWLTVFDLASTSSSITTLSTSPDVILIQGSDGNNVVGFSNASTGMTYSAPTGNVNHVICGLTAGSSYDISTTGGNITISSGSSYTATSNGTITFVTNL